MTHRTWNPELAYNDLPPLPPAVDLESKAVLKQSLRHEQH